MQGKITLKIEGLESSEHQDMRNLNARKILEVITRKQHKNDIKNVKKIIKNKDKKDDSVNYIRNRMNCKDTVW